MVGRWSKRPVKPGDPNVGYDCGRTAHEPSGQQRFLGDGQVRRAGGDYQDASLLDSWSGPGYDDRSGQLVVGGRGYRRVHRRVCLRSVLVTSTGYPRPSRACTIPVTWAGVLALAQHDFRGAGAEGTVVVHLGEPQVLVWQVAQSLQASSTLVTLLLISSVAGAGCRVECSRHSRWPSEPAMPVQGRIWRRATSATRW